MQNVPPAPVISRGLKLLLACLAIFPLGGRAAPGDLYVGDYIDGKVYRVSADGTKNIFVSGLAGPEALAFDTSGNLFVADQNAVIEFTPTATKTVFASGLRSPIGLAFDSSGNLFVADTDTIFKFTPNGSKTVFASGLSQPAGMAFDSQGNLFEADYASETVFKFAADGSTKTKFASINSINPLGLAFDTLGNLFMGGSNPGGGGIFEISAAGAVSTFAPNVSSPWGLAFNDKGDLFSSSGQTVLKFTREATRTTFSSGYQLARPIAFEPVPRKLLNISARGFADTGDKTVIAGFIVGGNALSNNAVLVRAIGPSLGQVGSIKALADPKLELHDASGAIIATNDDWESTQKAQIIATGLAPTDPHEPAIFAILPAGNYTAVVGSANETSGIAVVEVYSLR
jgi:hypothetical protein